MTNANEAYELATNATTWDEWRHAVHMLHTIPTDELLDEYPSSWPEYGDLENGFEWAARDAAQSINVPVTIDGNTAVFCSGNRSLTIRKVESRYEGETVGFISNPTSPDDGYGDAGRQALGLLDAVVNTWWLDRPLPGAEITARRRAAGLSQRDLAAVLQVAQDTLSKWELETRVPRDPSSVAIAFRDIDGALDLEVQTVAKNARTAEQISLQHINLPYTGMREVAASRAQGLLAAEGLNVPIIS